MTKVFADGADLKGMLEIYQNPIVKGFTTNPTLMKKAGVRNYREFGRAVLSEIKNVPVCFEVFADNLSEIERQALELAAWGENVVIKIPITDILGRSNAMIVRGLSRGGVKINVTAITTVDQAIDAANWFDEEKGGYLSAFAGRIADTGVDPIQTMSWIRVSLFKMPKVELIWASPREVLNYYQANSIGCHIITMTNDMIKKLDLIGKNLNTVSLDIVKQFYEDGQALGYDPFQDMTVSL